MNREQGPREAWNGEYPIAFGHCRIMRGRMVRADDLVQLELVGEFDLDVVSDFTATLGDIEATGPRSVVVNLCGLDYMDSSGIAALLAAHGRARGGGARRFGVLSGDGPVRRVFEIVGLDTHAMVIDGERGMTQKDDGGPEGPPRGTA